MFSAPSVLVVSDNPQEIAVFKSLLGEQTILKNIENLHALRVALAEGAGYDAVLCAWSVGKITWKVVLRQVLRRCPDLPVIVYCRTGAEQEWVQVLKAGAFDLLAAPYLERNVLPVLEQAIVSCQARRVHMDFESRLRKTSAEPPRIDRLDLNIPGRSRPTRPVSKRPYRSLGGSP